MEKRALLAIVLSIAVITLWQIFFTPTPEPPRPPESAVEVPGPASEAQPQAGTPAHGDEPGGAAGIRAGGAEGASEGAAEPARPVQAGAKQEFRITTQDQDIRFTNEGGRVIWWRLPRYTINGGVPVDLIPEQARLANVLPLQVEIPDDEGATRALASGLHEHTLEPIPPGDHAQTGPGTRLTFRWADGDGLAVVKTLDVPESGYLVNVSYSITRGGRPIPATLVFASGLSQPVENDTQIYGHIEGQGVVHDGIHSAHNVIRFAPGDVAERRVYSAERGARLKWAGLESTYFAALALGSVSSGPGAAVVPEMAVSYSPRKAPPTQGADPAPLLAAGLPGTGGGEFRLFVGPKDYKLLQSIGQDLYQAINFSNLPIVYPCTRALFVALTWIKSWVGNYGWSIIILTFFVRLIFFPISFRSMITMRRTSKKMTKVQPKVKAIQERYRKMKRSMETQQKMNQEIMALYKKEGVNPMSNLGGCLPLLLQMPVFIAFYNLLAVTIEVRRAPFMAWIQDLSSRDPYYITPLLMGASWLLQQAMTSSSIPDPVQRRMMMLMPAVFTLFMINMPSGLVLYWLTNNVLGMVQQYLINRKADQIDAGHAHREPPEQKPPAHHRRAEDGQTA